MTQGLLTTERMKPAARFALAGVLLSTLLAGGVFCQWVLAEGRGVVVDRDKDNNISVMIDPSQIPNVKIHRNNGQMMLTLEDDGRSRPDNVLYIDNQLRSASLVQVSPYQSEPTVNRASQPGRQVLIKSDKVFLNIKDLSNYSPTEGRPSAGKLAQATLPENPVPKSPLSLPAPVPVKPAVVAPRRTTPAHRYFGFHPILPHHREPAASVSAHPVVRPAVQAIAIPAPSSAITEPAKTPALVQPDAANTPLQLPPPEPAFKNPPLENDDSIPLSDFSQIQKARSLSVQNMLFKIGSGLVFVLLLIVGFFQYGLPLLMEKFPNLFKNAKLAHEHKTGMMSGQVIPGNVGQSIQSFWKKPKVKPEDSDPVLADNAPEHKLVNPMSELQKLDPGFKILETTRLGKDQAIHLVDIRGRQLVVGTTPYSINLIQDMTHNVSPIQSLSEVSILPSHSLSTEEQIQSEAAFEASYESPPATVYEKYLPRTPEAASSQQRSSAPKPQQVVSHQQRPLVNRKPVQLPPLQPRPVRRQNKQNVVLLEDYDDVYGQ